MRGIQGFYHRRPDSSMLAPRCWNPGLMDAEEPASQMPNTITPSSVLRSPCPAAPGWVTLCCNFASYLVCASAISVMPVVSCPWHSRCLRFTDIHGLPDTACMHVNPANIEETAPGVLVCTGVRVRSDKPSGRLRPAGRPGTGSQNQDGARPESIHSRGNGSRIYAYPHLLATAIQRRLDNGGN